MNEPTESMSSTDVNAIFKSVREHQLRDLETQLMREKYHQNPSSKEIFS